jgi:hypothetical protein
MDNLIPSTVIPPFSVSVSGYGVGNFRKLIDVYSTGEVISWVNAVSGADIYNTNDYTVPPSGWANGIYVSGMNGASATGGPVVNMTGTVLTSKASVARAMQLSTEKLSSGIWYRGVNSAGSAWQPWVQIVDSTIIQAVSAGLDSRILQLGGNDISQASQILAISGNTVTLNTDQSISGNKTFINSINVGNTSPSILFTDTNNGTVDNINARINYDASVLAIQSRSDINGAISDDYRIVKDAQGASSHEWRLYNNTNNAVKFTNGSMTIKGVGNQQLTVTASDTSGAGNDIIQQWTTAAGGGIQLRVDSLSGSNPTWNLNRNSGESQSFTSAGDYSGKTGTHIIGNRWAFGGPLAQRTVGAFSAPFVQVEYNSATACQSIVRNTADGSGPAMTFAKTRGTNVGDVDSISAGDQLFRMQFIGSDGTSIARANGNAEFRAYAPDTSGSGFLTWYTAKLGSLAENMRLDADGNLGVGLAPVFGEGLIQLPNSGTDKSGGVKYGTNTYIYRSGTNQLTLAAGGSPSLVLNSTADISAMSSLYDVRGRVANLTDVQALSGNSISIASQVSAVSGANISQASQISAISGSYVRLAGSDSISGAKTFVNNVIKSPLTVASSASILIDFNSANVFTVTLATSATLVQPANLNLGQRGTIIINQDATGTRTLNYQSNWKFPAGAVPTLTTSPTATDILDYLVIAPNKVYCNLIKDIR